jgi:hypothetical protein
MKRILFALLVAGCGSNKPAPVATPTAAEPSAAETHAQPPQDGAAAGCNADALKDAAMEDINSGEHAHALENLERSLACKDDPYVQQLAFMESCASGNAKSAKLYYARLTPRQQEKFAHICDRQKPPVPYK